MTLWEFAACMDGFRVFHGGKAAQRPGEGMSEERLAELGIEGFEHG